MARRQGTKRRGRPTSSADLGRLDALQAVASALSAAVTPSDVAEVVLDRGIALLGARAGSVSLLVDGDGGRLRRLQSRGIPDEILRAYDSLPVTAAGPAAEAARTGQAVWLESHEALQERFPHLAEVARGAGTAAVAAIALVVRGRPIGALSLVFQAPRRFARSDRTFAIALADACAVALERAQLFESERQLRARAEETASLLQDFDQFRLLVDQVKDYAIFMLDPSGNVRSWNRGAERIKGYSADEILGTHFSRFYPEEDVRAGKPERELAVAAAEGHYEEEGTRVRKDGSTFWANVVITALRDPGGTLRGFAKVTRDITDRRRAEEQRVRLARSQEATRARDEFLSIASHEFKTPITSLGLQAEVLLRMGVPSGAALLSSAQPRLQTIHRQTVRLARLVQALLDVTHITAGRIALRPEPLDLASVVRSALDRWRDDLSRAHCPLELRLGESIQGRWDRVRIEQIIDNLVANAVKFGAGKPVEVAVEADAASAHLVVRDHGIGIAPDDQRRIFERFERAVPTKHYGGFGLGLWIVRNIVEAHGGEISVFSEPGRGSRFEVTLPLQMSA
jgi:PAS domain S-box-containing protein